MADFDDLVRAEAYRIWESEGRPDGQHECHWRMALERVHARMAVTTEAPVVLLSLKRIALSARSKGKGEARQALRASA